jgi:hypothetical protein
MIVNNELDKMWKEVAMTYYKISYRHPQTQTQIQIDQYSKKVRYSVQHRKHTTHPKHYYQQHKEEKPTQQKTRQDQERSSKNNKH